MTTTQVRAITDTYVCAKYPTTNSSANTRLYVDNRSGYTQRAYVYFAVPFKRGTNITSAKLHLWRGAGLPAGRQFTVNRAVGSWSAGTITWYNKPSGAAGGVTVTAPAAGANTELVVDITSLMQSVASGATWYGLIITGTPTEVSWFHSAQSATAAYRPWVEITWNDAPQAPTVMYPSGGRIISTRTPHFTFNFTDVLGSTTMSGYRVQISTASNFSTVLWDSGAVASNTPNCDSASFPTPPSLAWGSVYYWRVQTQDGAGLWSPWSVASQFSPVALPTLSFNSPARSELARNLSTNPRASSGATTGWNLGTVATSSVVSTGGPSADAPSYIRQTFSTAETASSNVYQGVLGSASTAQNIAAAPGDPISLQVWVRSSVAVGVRATPIFYNSSNALITGQTLPGTTTVQPNTWTLLKIEGVVAPAGASQLLAIVYRSQAMPAGSTFDVSGMFVSRSNRLPGVAYFDGDEAASGIWTYSWAGTPGLSQSIAYAKGFSDTTPPVDWQLSFGTASAYQLMITYTPNFGPPTLVYDSGRVPGPGPAIIPEYKIFDPLGSYDFLLRVWDNVPNRQELTGAPAYAEVRDTFRYVFDDTLDKPTNVVVSSTTETVPHPVVRWSRTTMPDKWVIYRISDSKGKQQVYAGTGDAPLVPGSTADYSWTDTTPILREYVTYEVDAIVNYRTAYETSAQYMARAVAPVLSDTSGANPVFLLDANVDIKAVDSSSVFSRASVGPPVLLTQASRGYQGKVTATLGPIGQTSPTTFRDRFRALASVRGKILSLLNVNESFQGFIVNATTSPRATTDGVVYDVSFDFYQTNG